MNKRQAKYWYNIYKTSLRHYGVDLRDIKTPTEKSLERARKQWKKATADLEDKPKVRDIYKEQVAYEQSQASYEDQPRDENFRTETASSETMYDTSLEEIQNYIDKINNIYEDTMYNIEQAERDVEGISKTFAIGSMYKQYITGSKDELLEFLYQIQALATEHPDEVALFISSSPEIDYVDAITLVPPSDIQSNFEVTMQTMRAIWETIKGDMKDSGIDVDNISTSFGEY